MHDDLFNEAYKSLNSGQKEAVDTIEGPVMVIAGPGTGKTQILTLRIANILKQTDTRPENILALTFTESGVRAMRERLRSYIGTAAYRVAIHTFHEFAGGQIKAYPDAYTRVIGGRPAEDLEKIEMLESLLDDRVIKLLRPSGNPAFYVPHILRAISLMKEEYITPDRFREIIDAQEAELATMPKVHEKGAHKGKVTSAYQKKEKGIAKNKELLFLYRAYDALLRSRSLYDFEDMILETITALENNEDMLRDLQETYQYILADEHQDVNASQNRILELLASYHERPNLFVVGDEKQAIYRFQGASLENFLYFDDVFSGTKTITLTDNYRSGAMILDAAHSLITAEPGPAAELRVPLHAKKDIAATVENRTYSHEAVEDDALVSAVQECVARAVPKNEIAIIVRTNREVERVAGMLRSVGVPATASADGDILTHPITLSVLSLIDAVAKPEDAAALFAVMHGAYWGIGAADLIRITAEQSYEMPLARILSDREFLTTLNLHDTDKAARIMEVLTAVRARMDIEPPSRVLSLLLTESGYLDALIAASPTEGARVVRRLYDEVGVLERKEGVRSLADVGRQLATYREHGIALTAPYIASDTDAVQVMTAHKSKGLEFAHVFVPHLTDNLWGGRKRAEYFSIPLTRHLTDATFDSLDDERRLLYVACTRAKECLHLSHASANSEGKALTPSRLLEEIDPSYLTAIDTAASETSFDPLMSVRAGAALPAILPELLKTLFLARGLSATSLNNYLKSPWDYFYRNLLRVPEVQSGSAMFGSAIHSVLERACSERLKEGKMPKDSAIKAYLDAALKKLPITDGEYVRLHERGFAALVAYLHHIDASFPPKMREEMRLRVALPTGDPDMPEVILTGMLDRLDLDSEGHALRVVDYKTGKPKTRGHIEGKTKSSNGEYHRQLVFYALLLDLHDDERLKTREGVLAFVEPDAKGEIHEEAYAVADEEIDALKKTIIDVSREIVTGAFLDAPCDPAVSSYCHLVELLQQNNIK